MTKKGYSLHIGINEVNPNSKQYNGWTGKLYSPEADAVAMQEISKSLNYVSSKLLLTSDATRKAFFEAVEYFQNKTVAGDFFLLTFSGHGGQVLDTSGDEIDGYDETWCFYDGQILDDEIHELLKTFKRGIRILIISDSCYSGTMLKNPNDDLLMWGNTERIDLPGVEASVRLISSSQEFEVSRDGKKNGLFTSILLDVWDDGDFEGNYTDFYEAIVSEIPYGNNQTPNHLMGGAIDEVFDNRKPFKV